MHLTPEEKEIGRDNYYEAIGFTRREFLTTSVVGAAAVSGAGLGSAYFGYKNVDSPLRVAVIGTGDEGQVLIGAMNPKYVQVTAICDIRPYNIHRAFYGDWSSDAALAARPGLLKIFDWKSQDDARKHLKVYQEVDDCLKDPSVEGVIIALPLHLHAEVAVRAIQHGKHVLTEKLMAHNVAQCKVMGRLANQENLVLAVGHQRHYSVLYDNARHLIRQGLLGELHHIRAQWHRGNLPGSDSWQQPLPGGEEGYVRNKDGTITAVRVDRIEKDLEHFRSKLADADRAGDREAYDLFKRRIDQWEAWASDKEVDAAKYGYESFNLGGRTRSALEELCRWRLFTRTGGGLMAELGSHQLDAASIFCSTFLDKGKKAHPLSVHAVGGRHTFAEDRHAEDHVYCMFEFPGPGYEYDRLFEDDTERAAEMRRNHHDPNRNFVGYWDPAMNYPTEEGVPSYNNDNNRKVVVTYSSINGNGFGGYGEVVMGTKGTIVLEREQEVMLFKDAATTTRVGVKNDKGGPTLDTQASGKGPAAVAKAANDMGPVSRGYTEEIEHWAYCIRNRSEENQPRCRAEVALGDAVIALTTNVAIRRANSGEGGYVQFDEAWFDLNHDATPDGSTIAGEAKSLGADLA
jgi:predicted dehydrogenase